MDDTTTTSIARDDEIDIETLRDDMDDIERAFVRALTCDDDDLMQQVMTRSARAFRAHRAASRAKASRAHDGRERTKSDCVEVVVDERSRSATNAREGEGEGGQVSDDDDETPATTTKRFLNDANDERERATDIETMRKQYREKLERRRIRKMFRMEEYVDEIPRACACERGEDELRRAFDAASGANIAARASETWTQCAFKTSRGLTDFRSDVVALSGEGDARDDDDDVGFAVGPRARTMWCKLKWESPGGRVPYSASEREIERVITQTFAYAKERDVLETSSSDVERAEWVDSLGKMAWLYASQILATQRDDKVAARSWLADVTDVVDPLFVDITRTWINDANSTPERYYFEAKRDDDTGSIAASNVKLARSPASTTFTTSTTPLTTNIGVTRADAREETSGVVPRDADASSISASTSRVAPLARESASDRARARHFLDALPLTLREIARDPVGDVALRAYATAALGAFVAYAVVAEIAERRARIRTRRAR